MKVPSEDHTRIKSLINGSSTKPRAWCLRHGAMCEAKRAHVHAAGVPCQDHSSMGKRRGLKGGNNVVFYAWARQRRQLQEPILVVENVEAFGDTETMSILGDLYEWERVLISPHELGRRSRRKRQFLVGALKTCSELEAPQNATHSVLENITSLIREVFRRPCEFQMDSYLIATTNELEDELCWARGRKHAILRHSQEWLDTQPSDLKEMAIAYNEKDLPGSFAAALSISERRRLEEYERPPYTGMVVDLGQEPTHAVASRWDHDLHTLTRGQGLTWIPQKARWFTAAELLTSMGFPLSDEATQATGITCCFSRCNTHLAPAGRTRTSILKQLGNGMHVNAIGCVLMSVLFKYASLMNVALDGGKGGEVGKPSSNKDENIARSSRENRPRAATKRFCSRIDIISTSAVQVLNHLEEGFGAEVAKMRRLRRKRSQPESE